MGSATYRGYALIIRIQLRLINDRLTLYDRTLSFYRTNFISFSEYLPQDVDSKLTPTAVIRFQVVILSLLECGLLSLAEKEWNIRVINSDITDYEEIALNDLFLWFTNLLYLQKIPFNKPKVNLSNDTGNDRILPTLITIDFSLLQRWTDQTDIDKNVLFVRTDYHDLFYDTQTKSHKQVNNFRVSTHKDFRYQLIEKEGHNDKEYLEFFLKNIFGYDHFNDGQYPILANALAYRDTIGLLPTGGGKSLIYQIACLLQPSISFVVCPIKSLMYDQKVDLEKATIQHVESITSDVVGAERETILNSFGNAKYFFVFISPERFQTQDFRERLEKISATLNFSYAVIDEVHCLSEWGHDFRTSYLNLSNTIKKYCGTIKFLGLTATASVNVLKDIQIEFDIDQADVKTLLDFTRPELDFEVIRDNGNKYGRLTNLLEDKDENENIFVLNGSDTSCGLIFTPYVNGKYGCHTLSNSLTNKFKTKIGYYSGSEPKKYEGNESFEAYKIKVQNNFKENQFPLLAATKAFGMGINKSNIRYTIHYGIPSSMEALYQEAGRAGRDKKPAKCYILLSEEKTDLSQLFDPDSSFEKISALSEKVKWKGQDVFRQIFLYLMGLDSIQNELQLLSKLHSTYSKPDTSIIVSARELKASKQQVEKGIYRLSNLGIVSDWTVENFFNGIFTVHYSKYTDQTIEESLLSFIHAYVDDFQLDEHEDRIKYTRILEENELSFFEKNAKILLSWSHDKFGSNRRESLKNVYLNCLNYESTNEGKDEFKKSLEAYFKFTQATHILQTIAENNNKKIDKWFGIFYKKQPRNKLISQDKLRDLEGNLQRFQESYQNNTGLNLLAALTILLQGKQLTSGHEKYLTKSLSTISAFSDSDCDYIKDQVYNLSTLVAKRDRPPLWSIVYKICRTEEEVLDAAKEFGDSSVLLGNYNERLTKIIKRIENGFR